MDGALGSGNGSGDSLPPPPPQNSDTSSTSAASGCGFTLHVQAGPPPGTGAMYDGGSAPTNGNGLAGYSWNQAITALVGGMGGGSTTDNIPAEGTWSKPLTLETAHYAILSIRSMLDNYVIAVNDARDSILKTWKGPAADQFKVVLKAFTDYVTALSAEMKKYNEAGPNNLLHIAHMNQAMSDAAGFIWSTATCGDGHDRDTPVTLSGDLVWQGTMVGAGQQMIMVYDKALRALSE